MTRPIFHELPLNARSNGHAGLWYEKYCNTWKFDPKWTLKATGTTSPKLNWVNTVTGTSYVKGPGNELLTEHHKRMQSLCDGCNALQLTFKTTTRLVIGIGQDHPVENGFLWHPTLGVPYIPGSSIKGMLRNWVLGWTDQVAHTSWFESKDDKGAGELIFLDALPSDVPQLEADVITPHYGPYYREPQTQPPADWHNPVPTPFLTVAAGAEFVIRVIQRRSKPDDPFDFTPVKQALIDAFDILGIGAKTAVGFGRLKSAGFDFEQFKRTCAGFTDFKNQGAKQIALSMELERLSAQEQSVAVAHLLETRGQNRSHYKRALREIVFKT